MKGKYVLVITFVSFLFIGVLVVNVNSAVPAARIYVDPQKVTGNVGDTVEVDIRIENARDLYSYEFRLSWTGSILNATNVTEGDFPSRGGIYETLFFDVIVNGPGVHGNDYVYAVNTLYAKPRGEDGGGTLATVTFTVESPGETVLDLYEVILVDSFRVARPSVWEDGYFNVTPSGFHVDPLTIIDPTLVPGNTFSVNITLSNATDVYGFGFKLGYNETLLNATQVSIIPFLDNPQIDKGINSTTGYLWVNSNSTTSKTVDNSRPIANVTFKVLEKGSTILDISSAMLNDTLSRVSHDPPFEHTPPSEDGYFSNIAAGYNVAVIRVRAVPDEVTAGEKVNISVTLKNLGGFNETFVVTLYYDESKIENRTVTLESATKEAQIFNWDTTGVSAGTYTIKAEASRVEGEVDTSDNVAYSSVTILERSVPSILVFLPYIGVAIVVIVAVAVYFIRFRKS